MSDLRAVLSDEDLTLLRAGYDRALMGRMAVGAVSAAYPPMAPWAGAVGEAFYLDMTPAAAKHRESVVLAVLAAQREGAQLAIHVYWALMEDHSVEEVLRTLYLAGAYAGLPAWTIAQGVTAKVFAVLKARAEAARVDASEADCRRVVGAVVSAVPS